MSYLLDTHTLIWAISKRSKLSDKVKEIFSDPSIICYYSYASVWEITIKMSLSKLDLGGKNMEDIFKAIEAAKFTLLPLAENHFIELSKLAAYHRDPFDRILIAQSIAEDNTLITADSVMPKYPVNTVW